VSSDRAEKILRGLLFLLVFWDFGLGAFAVLFAHDFEALARFTSSPDPLWARGTGMYWLFAGWFQLLGWRNPRKYLVAVQLSILFRLSAACIDTVEALVLIPKPFYFFHYTLLFFVVMNVIIAGTLITCLKRMNLPWIEFQKAT
jgi:hypothetical protein